MLTCYATYNVSALADSQNKMEVIVNTETPIKRKLHLSKRMLIGIVVALVLLAAVGGGAALAVDKVRDDNQTGGEIENLAPGALNVTDLQARSAVQAAYPDATIESVDLDGENGGDLMYDLALGTGEEIQVNARTGEILGPETDDADHSGNEGD